MAEPFDTADFTWGDSKPTKVDFLVLYEDGPQPRDAKGRFRKRQVYLIDPKEESNGKA